MTALPGTTRMDFAYLCGCGRWSFSPDVHCPEEGEPTKVIPASIMDDEQVLVTERGYDRMTNSVRVRPAEVLRAVLAR